jgi:hypothetical protein
VNPVGHDVVVVISQRSVVVLYVPPPVHVGATTHTEPLKVVPVGHDAEDAFSHLFVVVLKVVPVGQVYPNSHRSFVALNVPPLLHVGTL